jgi:hypothetical protein
LGPSLDSSEVIKDVAENPGLYKIPLTPGDLKSVIRSARNLGISESSECPEITSPRAWFHTADSEVNYHTGERIEYCLHVEGVTLSTLKRIHRVLTGRLIFSKS